MSCVKEIPPHPPDHLGPHHKSSQPSGYAGCSGKLREIMNPLPPVCLKCSLFSSPCPQPLPPSCLKHGAASGKAAALAGKGAQANAPALLSPSAKGKGPVTTAGKARRHAAGRATQSQAVPPAPGKGRESPDSSSSSDSEEEEDKAKQPLKPGKRCCSGGLPVVVGGSRPSKQHGERGFAVHWAWLSWRDGSR